MKEKDIVESLIEFKERGVLKGMRFEVVKIVRDLAIVKDHRIPAIQLPFRISELRVAIEHIPSTDFEHNDY
jgi:hypothetical protein